MVINVLPNLQLREAERMFKKFLTIIKQLFSNIRSYIKFSIEKGAIHILIGNFSTKFVAFFGSVFLSRFLNKTDLGNLAYMENIYGYAYVFAGLGLSNALLRFSVLSDSIEKKYGYYRYSIIKGTVFNFILVIILIIGNIFYKHPEQFSISYLLLPILFLSLPFQDLITQVQINERAMQNNKRYALNSVISALLIVLSRTFSAKYGNLNKVVYSVLFAHVLVSLVLIINTKQHYFKNIVSEKLLPSEKNHASNYAFQYMITNGLWSVFMLTNIFMLSKIIGDPVATADFKISYAFPANMSIVSSSLGIFVTPYFVKNEQNINWVRNNYRKNLFLSAIVMGVVSISIFILAKPLLWLFGEQYLNNVPLMRLLILGTFIDTAFRFPTANILASIGKVKHNMVISAIGFIIQATLNLFTIPKYGPYGVGYTMIIVQSVMASLLFWVMNKDYRIFSNTK